MSAKKLAESNAQGKRPTSTLQNKKPLQRQLSTARAYATTQEEQEGLQRSTLRPGDKPLDRTAGLKQVGRRKKREQPKLDVWHADCRSFWGGCVLCGKVHDPDGVRNGETGAVLTHGHHAYTQGAHADWKFARWNAMELCDPCHLLRVHRSPELEAAFKRVADERKSAEDKNRPEFLPSEAAPFINDAVRAEAERKEWTRQHKRKEAAE